MKCPECGHEGWFSIEDKSISLKEDGTVSIARGSRWGQKIKMTCNNMKCDVVVNMYLDMELEPKKMGIAESTGAKEISEQIGKKKVKMKCSECGDEFIDEINVDISRDAEVRIFGREKCPDCNYLGSIIKNTLHKVDPEVLKD